MNYIDHLKEQYWGFREERRLFQKLERLRNLATALKKQSSAQEQKSCEAVIIRMIRDLQQDLAPDEYEAAKARIQTIDPSVPWLGKGQ